jgi:hypothetical protein
MGIEGGGKESEWSYEAITSSVNVVGTSVSLISITRSRTTQKVGCSREKGGSC